MIYCKLQNVLIAGVLCLTVGTGVMIAANGGSPNRISPPRPVPDNANVTPPVLDKTNRLQLKSAVDALAHIRDLESELFSCVKTVSMVEKELNRKAAESVEHKTPRAKKGHQARIQAVFNEMLSKLQKARLMAKQLDTSRLQFENSLIALARRKDQTSAAKIATPVTVIYKQVQDELDQRNITAYGQSPKSILDARKRFKTVQLNLDEPLTLYGLMKWLKSQKTVNRVYDLDLPDQALGHVKFKNESTQTILEKLLPKYKLTHVFRNGDLLIYSTAGPNNPTPEAPTQVQTDIEE